MTYNHPKGFNIAKDPRHLLGWGLTTAAIAVWLSFIGRSVGFSYAFFMNYNYLPLIGLFIVVALVDVAKHVVELQ